MKKIILLICMLIFVTGCTSGNKGVGTKETGKTIEILETKSETPDIELEVKVKNFALFDTTFKNNSNNNYLTGWGWDFFYRKNNKDEWKNITPDKYEVTDEGVNITKDKDLKQEINFSETFNKKEFDAGEYKLVKTIMNDKNEDKQVYFTFLVK
ncbi:hypothetical protein GUI37_09390 [Helcococcus kunzii]|uniref:membrane lipoprotein lipid attachment site-containing protein n=1 Tax=Helcococcus kunzii TaxID=40091 RepID=UPI001BAE7FCD|nr:membrane lipoprotein lipid attachment site-containing protein [Helcococcus kunzii]QUY65717.1 hypothetical protein GUI37_09390 [Helcococcus kunzii]